MGKFIGVDRTTGVPVESGCTKACSNCECTTDGIETINKVIDDQEQSDKDDSDD